MSAITKLISTSSPLDSPKQQACTNELDGLLQRVPEVIFASLSLLDGRTYATSSIHQIDPQRIAALSSSLLALSESFAREVQGDRCNYVTVSMELGVIVTVRVPTGHAGYILSIFVDKSANLAMALRWALGLVDRVIFALS